MAEESNIKIISPHPGFQENFVRSNVDVVFGGGILGGGKLQPIDSKILTPDGWKTMGDMHVGTTVLTPFHGEAKVTGVFPQGVKDVYRVKTCDGRVCEAGLEHLWEVRTVEQLAMHAGFRRDRDFSVLTTEEIIAGMSDGIEYFIPLPEALEFEGGPAAHLAELCRLTSLEIDMSNPYNFFTKDRGICDRVVYLCRSLGGIAFAHETASGEGTGYIVEFGWKSRHVCIESITYECRTETQCIMVDDSDHLYITDDFITTHNTFGAILATAEPSLDPNFRACFTRRTFGELKTGGGVVDDFESCFGDYADIKKTEPPRVTFPSGAFVEMRQINNEDSKKVIENWKGAQFDLIYMDELTSYLFSTFKYLLTRNRGKGKWTGKFRATTNPEKNCWIRKFIDWYIGLDGMIIPERDGVVRYFYINGDTVEDVVWGDSKEEVYDKARIDIDRKLRSLNKKGQRFTYSNLIKSFTFYLGNISENLTLLDGNMDYVGSVAAVGGKQSQQLIEGNWNVSSFDNEEAAIKSEDAQSVFMNDPQVNGDRWITADLADVGDDNTVILTWDGFHIIDIEIMCVSSPRQNAARLMATAAKHNIPLNHIIYDGTRAAYMNDYIPDAQAFISSHSPVGMYFMTVMSLKDECYLRLCELIKRGMLSISEAVARKRYQHVNLSQDYSIQVEFLDECSVVAFKVMYGGRKRLLSKKEMNQALGKGRSMDLLDPMAYRMLPCLEYEYGDELNKTAVWNLSEDEERGASEKVNVFDESLWC